MSNIINVILSGGSGTRLWPLSRQSKPKQFLRLFEGKSLFQHTLLRNISLIDSFMLVTNATQDNLVETQANEINVTIQRKIIEPSGKNTAAAIALACFAVNENDVLFVTPSDQMIQTTPDYAKAISRGINLAIDNYIVTFGIRPDYPETGFGYIEHNGEEVSRFHEKPSFNTASMFLSAGNFLWNSGMFCFKAGVLLKEMQKHHHDVYETTQRAFDTWSKTGSFNRREFEQIYSVSIDYAVMEKSDKVKVVPSSFKWTDLGSYKSLIDYHVHDHPIDGLTKIEGISCSDSYAFSKKKVYGYGLDKVVIVETEDCILVLPFEKSQHVKDIYERIKQDNCSLLE